MNDFFQIKGIEGSLNIYKSHSSTLCLDEVFQQF